MNGWHDISFRVDNSALIKATKYQINLLKQVDLLGNLYEGYYLQRALYRYEFIWLPMLKFYNDGKLIPPIDVMWCHYLHKLVPTSYHHDMKEIFQINIDHQSSRLRSQIEIIHYYKYSQLSWENFSNVNYDFMKDRSMQMPHLKSKISCDLAAESLKSKHFYYQVSLPHFLCEEFIHTGIDRYKKFLFLNYQYPNTDANLTKCFLIEIIWRSHLQYPSEYKNDLEKILHKLLPHDNTFLKYLSLESKNNVEKLWKQHYDEDFFQMGDGYRIKPLISLNNLAILNPQLCNLTSFTMTKYEGVFKLKRMKIENKTETNEKKLPNFKVMLCRLIKNENEKINTSKLKLNQDKYFSAKFFNFNEENAETCLMKVVVEEFSKSKLLSNIVAPKISSFNTRIILPKLENENDIQISKNSLIFQNKNQTNIYELEIEWEVQGRYKTKAIFFIEKKSSNKFDEIQHKNILNNFIIKLDMKKTINVEKQQLVSFNNQNLIFDVETLVSSKSEFFGLRILYKTNPVSTSYPMNESELPNVKYEDPCISLDSYNEKAVLIRNSSGDYAILKAQIYYFPIPILKLHWYSFETNTIQIYKFTNSVQYKFQNPENNISAVIDLEKGMFNLDFKQEATGLGIESFLCCVLTIIELAKMVNFRSEVKKKKLTKVLSSSLPLLDLDF